MAQRRRCDVWRGGLVFLGLLLLLIGLLAACGRTIDTSGTAGSDGAATRAALVAGNPLANPTVTVSNFIFTPASLTIDAGQTVTWNNTAEFTSHTATSDSGAPAAFDGLIGPGASFTFTFAARQLSLSLLDPSLHAGHDHRQRRGHGDARADADADSDAHADTHPGANTYGDLDTCW